VSQTNIKESTFDKGGKSYWDGVWDESALTEMADPSVPGIKNVGIRLMAEQLHNAVSDFVGKRVDLVEMGCGNSAWLPYFSKRYGFSVTGVDYSERGCSQERRVLAASGVQGDVFCTNFLEPPDHMIGKYDLLTSFGVAEHFVPTEGCISAFSKFLRAGGRMITVIPNVCGMPGLILRQTNRALYEKHVPLDSDSLKAAHEAAGLDVVYSKPILPPNFYVMTTSGLDSRLVSTKIKAKVFQNLGRASLLAMTVAEKLALEIPSRMMSPYFICVADKVSSFDNQPVP
jgi:2-polyprenyl-3-methyl-5-hydroxy-6-metoxy-1,4-benzoquinol methylase